MVAFWYDIFYLINKLTCVRCTVMLICCIGRLFHLIFRHWWTTWVIA